MSKAILMVVTLSVCLGYALWQFLDLRQPAGPAIDQQIGPNTEHSRPAAKAPVANVDPADQPTPSSGGSATIASADLLGSLERDKRLADAAVAQAQARIDALDAQVSQLEFQVSDIERRGDDPVDHAEEVLPYLRPVMAEFFDAQAELEGAQSAQARVEAALMRARQAAN